MTDTKNVNQITLVLAEDFLKPENDEPETCSVCLGKVPDLIQVEATAWDWEYNSYYTHPIYLCEKCCAQIEAAAEVIRSSK